MGFPGDPRGQRGHSGDRRLQRRYPIELDLEFRMSGGAVVCRAPAGPGTSAAAAFSFMPRTGSPRAPRGTRGPLARGLGNAPFLELRIFGRLVRNDSAGALGMSRYHFEHLQPGAAFEESFAPAMIQWVVRTMTLAARIAHSSRIPEVL